jgi:hypothetical protein
MPRKKKVSTHAGPHKLMRINWKTRRGEKDKPYYIFKCQIAGCAHYKPRDLVIGDETICWRCGNTFQMSYASTYLKKPHCPSCTETKGSVDINTVTDNLDKILGGI